MKFLPTCAVVLSVLVAGASWAEDRKAAVQEQGTYTGTGRACAGQLKVTAERISWLTPFSRCSASRFVVMTREGGVHGVRVAYRILDAGPKCLYRVLLLTHGATDDADIGWNVVGFPTAASFDPEKPERGLSCYLVK